MSWGTALALTIPIRVTTARTHQVELVAREVINSAIHLLTLVPQVSMVSIDVQMGPQRMALVLSRVVRASAVLEVKSHTLKT